jgi:hypothetical protein
MFQPCFLAVAMKEHLIAFIEIAFISILSHRLSDEGETGRSAWTSDILHQCRRNDGTSDLVARPTASLALHTKPLR